MTRFTKSELATLTKAFGGTAEDVKLTAIEFCKYASKRDLMRGAGATIAQREWDKRSAQEPGDYIDVTRLA